MHSGSKDQWAQGCLHSHALCLCIQLLPSVLRPVLPGVNKVGASSRDPKGRIPTGARYSLQEGASVARLGSRRQA